jgi:hypothetical protein
VQSAKFAKIFSWGICPGYGLGGTGGDFIFHKYKKRENDVIVCVRDKKLKKKYMRLMI